MKLVIETFFPTAFEGSKLHSAQKNHIVHKILNAGANERNQNVNFALAVIHQTFIRGKNSAQ